MILELALITPIYLWVFIIYFKFRYIINIMSELEKIFSLLNDNNQVLDEVGTPEEGVIQCKKRDVLKDVIKKGKAHLLGGNKPWSIHNIDKANDKVIDKLYQNFTQLEMCEKAENTGKTMGKHIVKLYTNGVNKF